jgi:hypothetical protein
MFLFCPSAMSGHSEVGSGQNPIGLIGFDPVRWAGRIMSAAVVVVALATDGAIQVFAPAHTESVGCEMDYRTISQGLSTIMPELGSLMQTRSRPLASI